MQLCGCSFLLFDQTALITSPPEGVARYCFHLICLCVCVCLCVCLSVCLLLLIIDDDPDVIAVTETWFDNSIGDSEFTPDGFTTFRKDRNTNNYNPGTYTQNDRAGVLLLIKNYLNPDAEILWVTLILN